MNHFARVHRLMEDLDEPLLVSSLVNVRYLTGFTGSNAFLYATPDGCTFLTDGRYGEIAEARVAELPDTALSVYQNGLYDRIVELFDGATSVGLEAAHITWETQRALASRYEGRLEAKTGVIEQYRSRKDAEEIAALRRAAAATDHAFSRLDALVADAVTEHDLGELLIEAMGERGGGRAGWPPIVATGANASRPHHESGDGKISAGLLLLDFGCVVDGYHSDMTRTVWRSAAADTEAVRVYEAVLAANRAGIAAVAPGVRAGDVDAACRAVLAERGYEEHFLHSTGHGVGLEIHEAPSVRKGSNDLLEAGQVITVEPGVYLPGRLGVRIEDMVVVTESGGEVLTESTKEMQPT